MRLEEEKVLREGKHLFRYDQMKVSEVVLKI